jgi:hypothetical protein
VLLWACILVAALLILLRRVFIGYPADARRFQVLTAREARFLDATAEVMFPADGAIPVSGLEADLPAYTDRFLASIPASFRSQIRALFMLVEQATLFFPAPGRGGFRRFSSLDADQRIAVLLGWTESRIFLRQLLFTALRAVLTMGYLGNREVMRYLRVAPYQIESPICMADLLYPPIGKHPDENPLGPDDLTPPSDGVPIALDGPLHPDYAAPAESD